jgi:hypothetical protein
MLFYHWLVSFDHLAFLTSGSLGRECCSYAGGAVSYTGPSPRPGPTVSEGKIRRAYNSPIFLINSS